MKCSSFLLVVYTIAYAEIQRLRHHQVQQVLNDPVNIRTTTSTTTMIVTRLDIIIKTRRLATTNEPTCQVHLPVDRSSILY